MVDAMAKEFVQTDGQISKLSSAVADVDAKLNAVEAQGEDRPDHSREDVDEKEEWAARRCEGCELEAPASPSAESARR
eukprot:1288512-Amphidinium_carterae.1